MLWLAFILRMAFHGFLPILWIPLSLRSSRSTEVIYSVFNFHNFNGSRTLFPVLPIHIFWSVCFYTTKNPTQLGRVQTYQVYHNVAVPSPQHSPMLGNYLRLQDGMKGCIYLPNPLSWVLLFTR